MTEEEEVEEISFGPVTNPDGSPTDFTHQMLGDTGRSLTPPFDFPKEGIAPVVVISAEGTGHAMLHEDDHLEMLHEDRFRDDMEEEADWANDLRDDGE